MLRRAVLALLTVLVTAVAFAGPVAAAPTPRLPFPIPDPCSLAPGGVLQGACDAVGDVINNGPGAIPGAVAGAAGDAAGAVTGGIFDQATTWLSGLLADTVKGALDGLGQALSAAPQPPLDQAWFAEEYYPLMIIGLNLCLAMLIIHGGWNLVRFRTDEIGRAFAMCLVAMFLTASAPLLIQAALQFADGMTAWLATWGGAQAGQLIDKVTEISSTITQTGSLGAVKPLLLILVLLVAVIVVLLWMLLLVTRSALVYLGTLAIPFVLPSIIDGKARFARIYAKVMFGIIMAAPVLFGVLVAGAYLIHNGWVSGDGLWPLITGVVLASLPILMPLAIVKFLIPAAAPAVHMVKRGGDQVVNTAKNAGMIVAAAATAGTSAAVVAAGAARATPHRPPPRPHPFASDEPARQPRMTPAEVTA